jgi:hypothetical protein
MKLLNLLVFFIAWNYPDVTTNSEVYCNEQCQTPKNGLKFIDDLTYRETCDKWQHNWRSNGCYQDCFSACYSGYQSGPGSVAAATAVAGSYMWQFVTVVFIPIMMIGGIIFTMSRLIFKLVKLGMILIPIAVVVRMVMRHHNNTHASSFQSIRTSARQYKETFKTIARARLEKFQSLRQQPYQVWGKFLAAWACIKVVYVNSDHSGETIWVFVPSPLAPDTTLAWRQRTPTSTRLVIMFMSYEIRHVDLDLCDVDPDQIVATLGSDHILKIQVTRPKGSNNNGGSNDIPPDVGIPIVLEVPQ